ncbi:hypothetical protein [Thermoflexus sp.]|nr:hypothetical protein [Thermoflexus sp.]MCS6963647.1 hypothetical protein [Thermoflexus sp.]MCX7691272.1 hypothetical protein [Thermoflexus sp.]MDW8185552.1 hypothetical protein [Anaerolineae bacterium]
MATGDHGSGRGIRAAEGPPARIVWFSYCGYGGVPEWPNGTAC